MLLASGYIAGGTLCGLVIAFFAFLPDAFNQAINLGLHFFGEASAKTGRPEWKPDEVGWAKAVAVVMFALLGAFLLWVGSRKERQVEGGAAPPRQGEQINV